MTKRQKALGCTDYGVEKARNGEWLYDFECFLAKVATIKKGQYIGFKLFSGILKSESGLEFPDEVWRIKYRQNIQPFLFALNVKHHDHFVYTDTNGLDCLTVK